tara:strand:+ start:155 stop:886 length:732 start_codon:yes stop_codon:yes gene_type:complete
MSFKNIHFILARPQMGENIGATARVLKNFNFTNLRIVNPRDGWPNEKAKATSVGAFNILKSSKSYTSIEKAVADLNFVVATSARNRSINKKMSTINKLKQIIKNKKKIGIIFGPEASGLSNSELSCADCLIQIPTNKKFSSINLSHSVMIFAYELYKTFKINKNYANEKNENAIAKKSEVAKFINFILFSLDRIGFLQPNHKKKSMINSIKNIFYRNNLSNKEIRILLGVFAGLNKRKIKKLN